MIAYPVAVEGGLINRGLRIRDLGSERCTWSDLRAVLYTAPPGSVIASCLGTPWSTSDYILANVVDLLNAANWQRGGDKNKPRPKPVKRPGENDDSVRVFGADPIAPENFNDWWDNG